MSYIIGTVLALVLLGLARAVRFDRDRSLYPVLLCVIASYYVLFAAMAGSFQAVAIELLLLGVFMLIAWRGFAANLWLVAAGLLAHGVQDFFHTSVIENPGVPAWWPGFCGSWDVVAAVFLAVILKRSGYLPARVSRERATKPPTSVTRVLAASLSAGVALAAVLVLGPFGGAPENVITGMALLGLAAGWALVAVVSARRTLHPQRWAAVPATGFAAMGALLLAWPGAVTSSAVAWGWPAVLAALVVWTFVRARRDLPGCSERWVVYPTLALLLAAAVGGQWEIARERIDRRALPVPGQLVDVGGYRLHLSCSGSGEPTVVLVPGQGDFSSVWGWIAPEVARESRVCVYDRAGRGWSESGTGPQDGVALAADLRTLLERADVAPPYVLVGHSFGGLYVRAFAAQYDDAVAGMVLLDATSSDMFTRMKPYPVFYEGFRRVSALFPTLARMGVGRGAYRSEFATLPDLAGRQELAFWSTPRMARSALDEWLQAPAAMEQARALRTLGDRPLMVVTAGSGSMEGWTELQSDLAALSANSVHRTLPGVTHQSMVYDREHAALAGRAIREVVAAVRAAQPLAR